MAIITVNDQEFEIVDCAEVEFTDSGTDCELIMDLKNAVLADVNRIAAEKMSPAVQYGPRNRKKWWHR